MSKKYLGIICLLYGGLFTYVVVFDKLKNFLAPSMQIYIKLSIIPLIIIGLVILFKNNNHYQFKVIDLVLILPLILLIFAGDGRLTSSFASNRNTNFKSNNVANKETIKEDNEKEEIEEEPKEEEKEIESFDFSNPYFDVVDYNYIDLAYYMAESSKAIKFEGKTIKVKGFALKDIEFMDSNYFAIGKYEISCCAADASYIGFIVKYDKNVISSDKWYEIEGVLEKGKAQDGNDIMYIKIINIQEINSNNEEQYVYPCYSYGEDACTFISKYNLDY